jgi:anthranilate phosphoribosyltransferase
MAVITPVAKPALSSVSAMTAMLDAFIGLPNSTVFAGFVIAFWKVNPLEQLTPTVANGCSLSRIQIATAVAALLDPAIADDAKGDFLTTLARKGETAEEIAAFALELRARAVDPGLTPSHRLDIVGTGADGANTFNISSCTMFVAAAAGIVVAKHGNRAVTSKCGSADVLAALGANIELPPEAARRCLDEVGVTFFFAPLYHPAFKVIAPVRKKLRQRTIFNILGPLLNPAKPTHQLVGVFDRALVGKFADVLRLLGLKRFLVVHGDGLDELTTFGPNTVAGIDVQLPPPQPGSALPDLTGGDPGTNAGIVRDILAGKERGPKRDIVLLNAAAALVVAEVADNFEQGQKRAAELIDTGAAADRLARFVAATNRGCNSTQTAES